MSLPIVGIEKKVAEENLNTHEKIISLKKKEIRKKYNSIPIDEYIPTNQGLKYVAIFNNGSQRVVSNVICEGIYDNNFTPQMIIEMFKRKVKSGYIE